MRRVAMSAFVRGLVLVAVVLAAVAADRAARAAGPVDQSGDIIKVNLDQARMLKLPEGTATLVVGNPLIADVAVQSGGTMVVTGKGYGNTNLVALDRNGTVILDHQVEVQGPQGSTVVV